MKCEECNVDLSNHWHDAVHTSWQSLKRKYDGSHEEKAASITVEIVHEGVRYRGVLYPVQEDGEMVT